MEKYKAADAPLSAEIAEPIIAKLALTDGRIANLICENFEAEWFANDIIAKILMAGIKKYYKQHGSIPKPSTMELMMTKIYASEPDKLAQALVNLKTIYSIDTTLYDHEYLDEQVLHYLKNVGLTHTIISNIASIQSKQELVCLDRLQKITSMTITTDMGLDYFNDMQMHLDHLKNPESKLSTYYESLDAITNGGFLKDGRCLVTFMAGAGVGKSLFLSNLASNYVKNDLFPIVLSFEMSEHVYAHRIDAQVSDIDMHNIRYKEDSFLSKIEKIKKDHPNSKLLIKEYPPESVSCNQIKTYIESVIRSTGRKPDVLIVDYLNLIIPNSGNTSNDNSYTKIGKVSRELRALSYAFNIPVITATQTNRSSYGCNVIPSLENTSESMGIVHVSDAIFAIYQNEGDREAGIMRLIPLKNRLGGVVGKSLEFGVNYNTMRIMDAGDVNPLMDDIQDILTATKSV